MNKITVLTPWIGDGFTDKGGGDVDRRRPKVVDDYGIKTWSDITAQPAENLTPTPNAYVIHANVDDATLAAIDADSQYTVLTVEVI